MKRKIHSIVYGDESYESKLEKLWTGKRISEGDIIELVDKYDQELKSLYLVLLVLNQDDLVNDKIKGIYHIGQIKRREIQLSNYSFGRPISTFTPGSLRYKHYKSMLENVGIWREKCKDWELEDKLRIIGDSFAKNRDYEKLEIALVESSRKRSIATWKEDNFLEQTHLGIQD